MSVSFLIERPVKGRINTLESEGDKTKCLTYTEGKGTLSATTISDITLYYGNTYERLRLPSSEACGGLKGEGTR